MNFNFIPIKRELAHEDIPAISSTSIDGVSISFHLSELSYRFLDTLFQERPELILEVPTGSYFTDLEFLQFLPNLQRLKCDSSDLTSIEGLRFCPKLTFFHLGELKNNNISFDPLTELPGLKHVSLTGKKRYAYRLEDVPKLTFLTLHSISLDQDNFLKKLTHLTGLQLFQGRISDFGFIKNFTNLLYLELNDIGNLRNLNYVGELTSLKFLHLENLGFIRNVDWMKNLPSLDYVFFYHLTRLSNVQQLSSLRGLKGVYLTNTSLSPGQLSVLEEMPNLEEAYFDEKDNHRTSEYRFSFERIPFIPKRGRNKQFIQRLLD